MMLLDVTIHLFDKRQSEITGLGDDDHTNDIPKKCCIDLEEVCAFWEGATEGIVVSIKNGESFWLKEWAYNKFKEVVQRASNRVFRANTN
jgi:hypothetical protein